MNYETIFTNTISDWWIDSIETFKLQLKLKICFYRVKFRLFNEINGIFDILLIVLKCVNYIFI